MKLPTQLQWVAGELKWFIAYADLSDTTTITVNVLTHAGKFSDNVLIDTTNNSVLPTVIPADSANITENSLIPVVANYIESAQISEQVLVTHNSQFELSPLSSSGYQWLSLEDLDNKAINIRVNNGQQQDVQLNLVANVAEQSNVIVLSPDNNQRFEEGELAKVVYSSNSLDSDVYRFTQISLFDFNRNLVATVLSSQESGKLDIRLPSVEQLDTFYINVRSYYGEQFRYSDREIGIRIAPKFQVPMPELSGITSQVFLSGVMQIIICLMKLMINT
ncbi:hypothetical protein L3081_19960 [Colwellia sp. MSW7]|uniref:Uncharacterized protein n=1 Tax=Colwellia maritima TaxID=2912588 RepID=A0ABS9X4W6_9GAMM|nr:hypothetical protein [Colwellia maritima]MCI2285234.1 hypothetical protein [Colwellia maritima]